MLMPVPPEPPRAILVSQATPQLPLLAGSDPMILGTYRWTLAHSPSLQQLVLRLASAEPRARYRLVPGLDRNYGSLVIQATDEGYEVDVRVPILAWSRCGDALEPWIASALFLALETASKGKLKETDDPNHLRFLRDTMRAAFDFQAKVRSELVAADPERLKGLPDGASLYQSGYWPGSGSSQVSPRRPLPDGLR